MEEARREVAELVEFLKSQEISKAWGRIPKGVLMVWSSGHGKTLLAKAIAGEADAAFFSISGSDFVPKCSSGGCQPRSCLFEQARKGTPACLHRRD